MVSCGIMLKSESLIKHCVEHRKEASGMEKKQIFHILEIEETKDEDSIRAAYRVLLKKTNPEDDPEGFKRLRQAYEEALRFAAQSDEKEGEEDAGEKDEVDLWIDRVEEHYRNVYARGDIKSWQELLSDPVCEELDTSMEAREKMLVFLMDHVQIPHEVWKLLDEVFEIRENREALIQQYPINFIDYVIYYIENETFIPYDLFEKRDSVEKRSDEEKPEEEEDDGDAYINGYLNVKRKIDAGEAEGGSGSECMQELNDLAAYEVYHPFEDVERVRLYLVAAKAGLPESESMAQVAVRLAEDLMERYPGQSYIELYAGEANWEAGQKEKAKEIWQSILERYPEHYQAKYDMVRYEMGEKQYYEARERMMELLEIDGQNEELMGFLQEANEGLIPEFREKLAHGEEDPHFPGEELKLELGWCLFQNERAEEAVEMLADDVPLEEQSYGYCNLYGRLLYQLDRYEEARPFLERWLEMIRELVDDGTAETKRRISRHVNACHILSDCYFELGRQEDAERIIEEGIEFAPGLREKFGCLQYYANILLKTKQYEKAVDLCDRIIKEDAQYYPAYLIRQECCYELHKAQEVIDDYHRAIDIFAGYHRPYMFAAEVFFHYSQYEDAMRVYKQARENQVEFSPRMKLYEVKVLRNLAENKEDRDKARAILEELEEARKQEECDLEDRSEVDFEKGLLAWDDGDLEEALEYLKKAIKGNPNRMQYRMVRGNIFADHKEYRRALGEYDIAGEDYKNSPGLYYGRALCYEKLNNPVLMVENYEKTLEMEETYGDACENLADYYQRLYQKEYRSEDFEKAIGYASRQLKARENCYYLVHRGLIYMNAMELDQAMADFHKALEYVDDDWAAWNNLGCCYKYRGEFEKAIEHFQKSVDCMDGAESVLPYSNMADCYEAMGDYRKAIECYEKDLEMFPNYQSFWEEIGDLYYYLGEYEEALTAYEKMRKGPGYDKAVGDVFLKQGKKRKAINAYKAWGHQSGKESNEDRAERYKNLGALYLEELSDYNKAMTCFKKALDLNSDPYEQFEYYRYLARCCHMLKKFNQAKEYAKASLESFKKSGSGKLEDYLAYKPYAPARLASLGWLLLCQGKKEEARENFQKMEQIQRCRGCRYRECFESRLYLGYYYEAVGDLKEAKAQYQEALKRNPHCDEAREALNRLG